MTFRRALAALTLALALLGGARRAEAQIPTRRPSLPRPTSQRPAGVRDTVRGPRDTLRTAADSIKADTTGVPNFLPPDSVMQRLMTLGGYNLTRYQANTIHFDAPTRGVTLTGRALVERDSQKGIVVGRGGEVLKTAGSAARRELEALLGTRVHLETRVKVEPRWQRRAQALDRLGL